MNHETFGLAGSKLLMSVDHSALYLGGKSEKQREERPEGMEGGSQRCEMMQGRKREELWQQEQSQLILS